MNPWVAVALLGGYTLLLVGLGRLGMRIDPKASGFVTADRRLSGVHVFVLVTAMWASWMYVTEVDEAYTVGVSAAWFGLAVIAMSLVVVALFVSPFRRLGFVTNSGLLRRAFGRAAGVISGAVIALTFPIFALGNVLAAAAFLHALLGWPILLTEVLALGVILGYVVLGGLVSLVYTQALNLAVMAAGIAGAAGYVALHGLPAVAPARGAALPLGFWELTGIGAGPILVWIFSDLVNVVSAQVEFQAITAVDRPRRAQLAVLASSAVLLAFVAGPVYLGIAARLGMPGAASGVLAYPLWALRILPRGLRLLVALSVWSAALTWSGPLLFSGACSLGLDVAGGRGSRAPEGVRRLVRWGLAVEALSLLAYTALRPGDLAWWSVFGLTVRNGAIFAPTVGLLLWPLGGRRSAVGAMVTGAGVGLLWNALTGFSPTQFALGLNPAWLGTAASVLVFVGGSLLEARARASWSWPVHPYGWLGWALALLGGLGLAAFYPSLAAAGLAGPVLLTAAVGLELGVISAVQSAEPVPQERILLEGEASAG